MPQTAMREGRNLGEVRPDDVPDYSQLGGFAVLGLVNTLGTRQEVEDELDAIAGAIRTFHLKAPDQVMREVAAYTARLTELCVLLHRVEAYDRQYTRVRTQQVERFLTELDRQFKVASRLVEVQRQDISVLGAMP